jgi:hypothetical protein
LLHVVLRSTGKWVPDGVVRYKDFATYLRLLEIELSSANSDKPMKQKLAILQQEYDALRKRTDKRNRTMTWNKRKSKGFEKIRPPPAPKDTSDATGYRWLKKAKAIAADVAKGDFPGRSYREH